MSQLLFVVQTRHTKPKAQGETGQITQNESPIHHSNVMLYSQEQKVRSKVGHRYSDLISYPVMCDCLKLRTPSTYPSDHLATQQWPPTAFHYINNNLQVFQLIARHLLGVS